MPKTSRHAGQNVRNLATKRRILAIYSFISAGFVVVLPLFLVRILEDFLKQLTASTSATTQPITLQIPVLFYLLLVVLAIALIANGMYLLKRAKHADQGAKAEEETAQSLDQLRRQGWQIEYGLIIQGKGDVDVVCISPQGRAYVIDVKSHRGEVITDGKQLIRKMGKQSYAFEKDFLRQVMNQALQVKQQKGLTFVTPILAFSQAKIRIPEAKVRGVYLVEKSRLIQLLQTLG